MDWVNARDRVTPILTTVPPDSSRVTPEAKRRSGPSETIARTLERENGGRTFAFTAADAHQNWAEASVRRVVVNGILWTAGREVPRGGAPVDLQLGALERNLDDKRKSQSGRRPARNPLVKYITPGSLPGIGLDDIQGKIIGKWTGSSAVGPTIIGVNYLHDGGKNKGEASIRFTPEIATAGEYEIILHAPPQGNRSKSVPVEIAIAGRPLRVVKIDQSRIASRGEHSLGRHQLPAGKQTRITVSNTGTTGVVVVDGLQLRP